MIVAETCKQFLADCGINPDRLTLEWASAAEAPRFVELITGYVNNIKEKGEIGAAEGEVDSATIKRRLKAAVKAAEARKPRSALGMLAKKLHKDGEYSKEAIAKGVSSKIVPALRAERIKEEMILLLRDGPMDIDALCSALSAKKEEVEKPLSQLQKKGVVEEKDGKFKLTGK